MEARIGQDIPMMSYTPNKEDNERFFSFVRWRSLDETVMTWISSGDNTCKEVAENQRVGFRAAKMTNAAEGGSQFTFQR